MEPGAATASDVAIQALLLIFAVSIFLFLSSVPRRALSRLRRRGTAAEESRRRFLNGARLLSSGGGGRPSPRLIRAALEEADRAIALDPRDAAPRVLRAVALDRLGRPLQALRAIDDALSPSAARSLAPCERADALVKRAQLRIAASGARRSRHAGDQAVADLREAVRIAPGNARAWCLLGECCEGNDDIDEAMEAFKAAMGVDPAMDSARQGLRRLSSRPPPPCKQ